MASQSSSVGILIHGCHLGAVQWGQIVFGDTKHPGRVLTGIEEAIYRNASLVFWGTGASEKEGLKESEYTYTQALGPKLYDIARHVRREPGQLKEYLERVSFIDKETQNTVEEIGAAIRQCRERHITELFLVSSPTHIARCHQEALKQVAESDELSIKIYAIASRTCFAQSTPGDVTIFEPPHRGDMPNVPIHKTVRGLIQFMRDATMASKINDALANLIELFNKEETSESPDNTQL